MKYTELDTPALLIDRKIMTENIRRMQAYADRYGVTNSHGHLGFPECDDQSYF